MPFLPRPILVKAYGQVAAFALAAFVLLAFTVQARANFPATFLVGNNITISDSGGGTPPFTYQWYKNTVAIPGATAATYDILGATAGDAGNYTVSVTNSAGTATSDIAILTLGVSGGPVAPPVIVTNPSSLSLSTGATASFTVAASSTVPLTYQWLKDGGTLLDGGAVSGATTPTLTVTGVTSADIGSYTCVVTNSGGSVTSGAAAVLVVTTTPLTSAAPVISIQPASKSAFVGDTVSLSVVATGLPAPTYLWRKNGVDLTPFGTLSPTLTLSSLTTADAGDYTVLVANSLGSVTSATATLTVNTNKPPVFTVQPVAQTANTGAVVFITGRASGTPTPTYQWQKNGVNLTNTGNITGANSGTLALSNVSSADAANYTLVATNSLASTPSNVAALTINGIPAFFTQPSASSIVSSGTIVTMAVTVAGDPTPTLQWRKDGVNLTNTGIITGATSTSLHLTGVAPADSGVYSVVATNTRGSATAGPFSLTVNPGNVWYQPVTTGKDTAISYPGATGSLQWQLSSTANSTWTNLTDSATYAGTNSDTLRITNPTSALNTVFFRLVSTSGGVATVLRTAQVNVAPAFLPFPVAVSSDTAGNLFVADTSSDTIVKINGAAQVSTLAGSAGHTGPTDGAGATAHFNNPSGVVTAADGSLIVTDNANATIRSITPAGVVTTLAGSTTLRGNGNGTGTAATFSSPVGVARDSAGTFFVADSTNHTIRKITTGAVVTTLAGSAGQTGSTDGTGSAARFNNPTHVAADPSGNIIVADTTNNLIRKVTPAGVVTTLAGVNGVSGTSDGTGSAALFNQPGGLAVDNAGNIYVADTGNSTIRRISPAGAVVTIAGLPGIAGLRDGTGTEAWFNQPRDLSLSPSGILYVADTGNASIRRIAPDASVTTLALTALPAASDPAPTLPLPEIPTLPSQTPAPTLPTGPTPITPASNSGGGGGAPSLWFLGSLGLLSFLRRNHRRF